MATAARCLCTLAPHGSRETSFVNVAGRTAYRRVTNARDASPAEKRYPKVNRELNARLLHGVYSQAMVLAARAAARDRISHREWSLDCSHAGV